MPTSPKTSVKPVYSSLQVRDLTGTADDYFEVRSNALALSSGTISMSFSLDRLTGDQALVSKDLSGHGAGQFTLMVSDGALVVSMDTSSGNEWLRVPDLLLSAYETYQVALSFGANGLMVWLNGALVASEPDFKQGIAENDEPLVIGGSRGWRSSDAEAPHSLLKGTIGNVTVFDRQLGQDDMVALAGAIDPELAEHAQMHEAMADLAPLFQQLHGTTDTFLHILHDYGVDHHGHMHDITLNMMSGGAGRGDHQLTGTAGADGMDGGRGNDSINGKGGDDVLQGGYGRDKLRGAAGKDILDGGHGEDILSGGKGNDLLISRADAREPDIYPDPDRDEDDALNELTNGKVYPDQEIPADDVLSGGKGADIFYFQTLINAKRRIIEKHTGDDGTINWHGVAGENTYLHDHWVDAIGNDVVMDFSRAEGDRIVIEGHTTEIASITYGDADGNGVMDHSVISLYSDQGSGGGAHNDDRLGTITVYGDLITEADIEHSAAPAYGIVEGFKDIKEAVTPTDISPDKGPIAPPTTGLPNAKDLGITSNLKPVLAIAGETSFSEDDRAPIVLSHSESAALRNGTIALSFQADQLADFQALFSKDASDNGQGGHIAAYINHVGTLVVRVQDAVDTHYFEVDNAISAGVSYDLAVSFGKDGLEVNLNGARVAYDADMQINLAKNTEAIVVGATGWNSTPGTTDDVGGHFNGTITNFMIFNKQLTGDEIIPTTARPDFAYFAGGIEEYGFERNKGVLAVTDNGQPKTVLGKDIAFIRFEDLTVRTSEVQFGTVRNDTMHGHDGADVLMAGAGNDTLLGRDNDDLLRGGGGNDELSGDRGADRLYGNANDDKLFGDLSADKLYGGAGADVLYGGAGADKLFGGLGDDVIFGDDWNSAGTNAKDKVFFDGNFNDFEITTLVRFDGSRGAEVTEVIVTDAANGGVDDYYEGRDRLMDIDYLVFADRTVAVADIL